MIKLSKEQTIDKIMEEYSEYGIEKWLAEQIYYPYSINPTYI